MGNEPSKKASSRGDKSSKSIASTFSGVGGLLSPPFCELFCTPSVSPATAATDESQIPDSVASTTPTPCAAGTPTDKQQNRAGGKSSQPVKNNNNAARPPKHPASQTPDKSDRSIRNSVRNVQMDVTAIQNEQKKGMVPMGDSAHTFAASLATASSGHFRKGNDYVMITDALSDVRAK